MNAVQKEDGCNLFICQEFFIVETQFCYMESFTTLKANCTKPQVSV